MLLILQGKRNQGTPLFLPLLLDVLPNLPPFTIPHPSSLPLHCNVRPHPAV